MPKVYDKDGRELTVGARVERVFPNGRTGGMTGRFIGLSGGHRDVAIEWDARGGPTIGFHPVHRRFPFSRAFTCPNLQLIDQPNPHTKEAASAASDQRKEHP